MVALCFVNKAMSAPVGLQRGQSRMEKTVHSGARAHWVCEPLHAVV